jgi:hypothetical protein
MCRSPSGNRISGGTPGLRHARRRSRRRGSLHDRGVAARVGGVNRILVHRPRLYRWVRSATATALLATEEPETSTPQSSIVHRSASASRIRSGGGCSTAQCLGRASRTGSASASLSSSTRPWCACDRSDHTAAGAGAPPSGRSVLVGSAGTRLRAGSAAGGQSKRGVGERTPGRSGPQ